MLSKDLENTLNLLFKECSDNNDEFVTIEHLLLVLTQEDSSRKVLDHLSIDIESFLCLWTSDQVLFSMNLLVLKQAKDVQLLQTHHYYQSIL